MFSGGQFLTSCDRSTNDTTNTGTNARGQDNESEWELLRFRLIDIGNQTKSNTSTSSRQTTLIFVRGIA